MRSKAIYFTTLLCVPAAAALIVNAPVAAVTCGGNEIPANTVRTAATAGDNYGTCTEIPDITLWQRDASTATH